MNLLKVEASELARQRCSPRCAPADLPATATTANSAMGRYLRDILSSPIMINNDRILASSEAAVLMSEAQTALSP